GRTGVTPERVAINVRDGRIADNAGARPVDEPVVKGGPVGHFTSLPIKAMVSALREQLELPAAVSQTAGPFVCNDLFYRLLHLLSTDPESAGVRGGFVHVPAVDALAVDSTARALTRLVEVGLTAEEDLALPVGAEHCRSTHPLPDSPTRLTGPRLIDERLTYHPQPRHAHSPHPSTPTPCPAEQSTQ